MHRDLCAVAGRVTPWRRQVELFCILVAFLGTMSLDALNETPIQEPVTQVLLVEDDLADAYMLRRLVEKEGGGIFRLEQVDRLSAALDRLSRGGISCVLLDLNLPDSFGFATFKKVSQHAPGIPVVVLSGLNDQRIAVRTVREGAQDYLVKGDFDSPLLLRAIRYAIERHYTQEHWRNLSYEDDLTSLYNRRGLMALGEQQLRLARRKKEKLLILFVDLDDLKKINDAQGHDAGNQAIMEAAELLKKCFRESDVVARLGGDEFIVLLDATDRARFAELADRLEEHVATTNRQPSRDYQLSLSFGTAEFDPDVPGTLEELIKKADMAMYAAKRRKKEAIAAGGER